MGFWGKNPDANNDKKQLFADCGLISVALKYSKVIEVSHEDSSKRLISIIEHFKKSLLLNNVFWGKILYCRMQLQYTENYKLLEIPYQVLN